MNAFQEFDTAISNEFVVNQLKRCQQELHEWGAANSVTFDPKKESLHILSHDNYFGNSFRLLGVTFDLQLRMDIAIGECCTEAHWKLSVLLRSRRFFTIRDLVTHYKS